MASFSISYGASTFKNWSFKGTVFAVAQAGDGEYSDMKFPGSILGETKGARRNTSAARDGFAAHGGWTQTEIDGPDGTLLLVKVDQSRHGSIYAQGAFLIALRDDADLIRIEANLPDNPNSAFGAGKMPLIIFTGKGDIIPPSEFADYGVCFRGNITNNYFDPEEIEETLTMSVIQHGKAKPTTETIEKDTGEKVRVKKDSTTRRITIRRGRQATA